ncbi:MAG TPA: hypothetical protein DIC42_00025 [Holosporales bacterium]|nr:hypothetical protein [Holosporales bacterium]
MTKLDPKLIQNLICPLTKTQLVYDEQNQELISQVAGLAYPIKKGIPIMLIDEARIVDPDQVRCVAPELLS